MARQSLAKDTRLKTWHESDNEIRQRQLKQEILDGKENTPIMITRDDVVLDGHGRLRAYLSLSKTLKALILPYTFDQLREEGSLGMFYDSSFSRYVDAVP